MLIGLIMYFIKITNMILFWLIFSLCQLLAQPDDEIIQLSFTANE
jgi:hypothetical protein